ncbi:MAG: hypothetical protein EOM05_10465 [Clostridia bacterium]|nr:hypothetical protein [Clostridia bacterium]
MIEEIGGIHALACFESDTPLNVYNAHTLHFLYTHGATLVTLSHELSVDEVEELLKNYRKHYEQCCNTQYVVYGRVEVMVSEHCPINATLLDNDKVNCRLCRQKTYALKDKFHNLFPMHNDDKCRMHLYDYKISDKIASIPQLYKMGVNAVRFDFTFEDTETVKQVIQKAKKVKITTENSKV